MIPRTCFNCARYARCEPFRLIGEATKLMNANIDTEKTPKKIADIYISVACCCLNFKSNEVNEGRPVNIPFNEFWEKYDKKVGKKKKMTKKWNSLNDEEREKAMKHIHEYKIAEPDKLFRKNPESYINQEAWDDEIIYKKNVPHTWHPLMDKAMDSYRGWIQSRIGVPAKIDDKEQFAMNSILLYFDIIPDTNGQPLTDNAKLQTWNIILDNWDQLTRGYLKSGIKLSQINANITLIIDDFRNARKSERISPDTMKDLLIGFKD